MTAVVTIAATAAAAFAAMRWLLVAQREHYYAPARPATTFAGRWWWGAGPNRLLLAAAVIGTIGTPIATEAGFVTAVAVAAGPFGFPLKGKAPGPLVWTRRLKTLAGAVVAIAVVVIGTAFLFGRPDVGAVIAAAGMPAIVDLALIVTAPIERRLGQRWVDQAAARLRAVSPRVVGITGSFGKTSTKNYVAHLAGTNHAVVASPRSFNNMAGLAMTINEHLVPGTEVFVAEMGTYGPGEIAAMCSWVQPSISAITAIGPVHLERFGSEERIVEAKREILDRADTVVLNVDDERLRSLAEWASIGGKRVIRCSTVDPEADVHVRRENGSTVICAKGKEIARADGVDAQPSNVAIAVAIAIELDTPLESIAARVGDLPAVPNRLTIGTGTSGATALDDTFNSNPVGAAAALDVARQQFSSAPPEGRKLVVVTPGMVELGPRQRDENAAFAQAAAKIATHLVVVGNTNRTALCDGASAGNAEVIVVDRRDEAIEWVKQNVGPGDVVLYENDVPDHYP